MKVPRTAPSRRNSNLICKYMVHVATTATAIELNRLLALFLTTDSAQQQRILIFVRLSIKYSVSHPYRTYIYMCMYSMYIYWVHLSPV